MKRLLLVEDQLKDLRAAAEAAESLGVEDVEACQTVHRALAALEKGLNGEAALPDGIVLDLDLGIESGYELLRYWHRTPGLTKIPVLVWSVIESQREVCELFKVQKFVAKNDGIEAFRRALKEIVSP